MTIQKRITNSKRHTVGFVIDSKAYTRKDAVKLARSGKISNAKVVRSETYGQHLVGTTRNLYDLPVIVNIF